MTQAETLAAIAAQLETTKVVGSRRPIVNIIDPADAFACEGCQ